jgi:VCBS repeat-containing protein
MSPAERLRRRAVPALAAVLLAGLLPASVLAVGSIAAPDAFTVGVNAAATSLDVLNNDTGTAPAITNVTDPTHGTATTDGTAVTYTPDATYHGMDSFDYTIDGTSTATATVTVNDPPVAHDDPGTACFSPNAFGGAFPIPEDFLLSGPYGEWFTFLGSCALVKNDTDANGDPLTYVIDSGPSHGSVFPDPDIFAYKPDPNFSTPAGDWISDSVTYRAFDGLSYSQPATMRFWIAPINDVPTFTAGGTVTVAENSGLYSAAWATNVSPGPNEADQTVEFRPDGPAALTGPPGLFSVAPAIDSTGLLTFTVAPGRVGHATATFVLRDNGGILPDYTYGTATKKADDTSDAFTFDIYVTGEDVIAVDDVVELPEDPETYPWPAPGLPNPWPIPVLENDTVPTSATISSVTQGTHGTVTIAPDGRSVLYGPNVNFHGSDSFTYTVQDIAGTDTATVDLTVNPTNDAPNAVADALTVAEDAAATSVDVLANDFDVDGDALTVTAASIPSKGTVVIAPDGSRLTYQPTAGATGSDIFTYTVTDGFPLGGGLFATGTATVTVTITAANDDPVAVADSTTLPEDAAATSIDVLANDTDTESGTLTITGTSNGSKGVVVLTSPTTLTYKPNANANGSDSFTYTISDGQGGSATGTVSVTISPVNDIPNAVNDATLTVPENAGATTLAVKANDTDADGDTLVISGATNGAHGLVAITGGGTGLTYDPVQGYFGTDVFTYTIGDGHGGADTATVLLTVVKDATKPVVVGPAERFITGTVGSTTTRARISWSGTDTGGTGISSYTLQVSVNGGAYSTVTLATATSTTADRTLNDGTSYRYRVRATDRQGNVSAYVYGPTFTPVRFQNSSSSVAYVGSWTTKASASALGGSIRVASSLSARASITRTVRDFAWVATKTPTSGSAQVWIDGALAATVNLRSTSTTYRQVVFQRHFSTLGSHRIEIRPIGGGQIDLDAFLDYR